MTRITALDAVRTGTTMNQKEADPGAVTVTGVTGTSRKEAGPGSVIAAVGIGPKQKKSEPLAAAASEKNGGAVEKSAVSNGRPLVSSMTTWKKESTHEIISPSEQ